MQDEQALLVDGTNPMIATLDMGNNRIINVGNPLFSTDGANKAYVDNAGSTLYLKLDGTNNMGAALNMGNHTINNVTDPTTAQQATTKNYTDTTFLKLDGTSSMAGNLNMNTKLINNVGTPAVLSDGANKAYTDMLTYNVVTNPTLTANTAVINGLTYIASEKQNLNVNYQPWKAFDNSSAGDACWLGNNTTNSWLQLRYPYPVIIGRFFIVVRNIAGRDITSWNIQGSNDGTTFTQIIASTTTLTAGVGTTISIPAYNVPYTYIRFNVVAFAGGVDVGINQLSFYPKDLDLNNAIINNVADPTAAQQATTKNYTDTTFLKLDGTTSMTGNLNMGTKLINNVGTPVAAADGVNKSYVDTAPFVKADGTTLMTGNLNINNNKINNLGTPVALNDGANKTYVDTSISTLSTQVSDAVASLAAANVYTADNTTFTYPTTLTLLNRVLDTGITPNPNNTTKLTVANAALQVYPATTPYVWYTIYSNGTYTFHQDAIFNNGSAQPRVLTRSLRTNTGTILSTIPSYTIPGNASSFPISVTTSINITGASPSTPVYVGYYGNADLTGVTRTQSSANFYQVSTTDASINWGTVGNTLTATGTLGSLSNNDVNIVRNNTTLLSLTANGALVNNNPTVAQGITSKSYVDTSIASTFTPAGTTNLTLNPVMTSNTVATNGTGYITSASSEFSTQPAWKAFQNALASGAWATNSSALPTWIQMQFPFSVIITGINVAGSPNTGVNRGVTSWNLAGSNDGTTFTIFYTGTGNIPGLNAAPVTFNFANTTPYTYIRLNVLALATASTATELRMIQWIGSMGLSGLPVMLTNGNTPMTNALNMSSNKIINLSTPTATGDAATKGYVDTATSSGAFLKLDGTSSMTGNINAGNNKVINLGTPSAASDAVTKLYTDTALNTTLPLFANSQHAFMASFSPITLTTTAVALPLSTVGTIFNNPKSNQLYVFSGTQFTTTNTGVHKFALATSITSGATTGLFAVAMYDVTAGASVYTLAPTSSASMNNVQWYVYSTPTLTNGNTYEIRVQVTVPATAVTLNGGYVAVCYPV
jgi:F5/8 type C domain